MTEDKRKDARIDFQLSVEIKGHRGVHSIGDFSLSGVFIQTENPSEFKPGDEIDLFMKPPHKKNAIQVKARVTRVTSKGIGVEFVNLMPQHALALESCFHVFKHTIPLPGT